MGRQQTGAQQMARPRRKATNSHIFRYLQTRNPSRLEENDLKKALEASLEECPEDSASCNSSEPGNATCSIEGTTKRRRSSPPASTLQQQHQHHHHHCQSNITANHCPITVNNRYKPVAKKNIYDDADFFHQGIMEYIEYELHLALIRRQQNKSTRQC